jgi:hypothetical protein
MGELALFWLKRSGRQPNDIGYRETGPYARY